MSKRMQRSIGVVLLLILLGIHISALAQYTPQEQNARSIVGLVVTPTEDDWQEELYNSVQRTLAQQPDIELMVMEASRGQEAQVSAIRALMVYQANVIVFCPVVESGWDNILTEAVQQGVGLIAVGKAVKTKLDLPCSYVGYEYYNMAIETAQELCAGSREGLIVELFGTMGSYQAKELTRAFRETLAQDDKSIGYSICGDYMRSRGREIIEGLIEGGYQMGAIISHNDAMTIGAVDALEKAGFAPGEVPIYGFGGGQSAFALYEAGWLDVLVRCDLQTLAVQVHEAVQITLEGVSPVTLFADMQQLTAGGGI